MKKKFVIFQLFLISFYFIGCSLSEPYIKPGLETQSISPDDSVEFKLYLIGDAGKTNKEDFSEVFVALKKDAGISPGKSFILFLGDNLYPNGMTEPGTSERELSEFYLDKQLEVFSGGVKGAFIPGNHDWAMNSTKGQEILKMQEDYILSKNIAGVSFLPSSGCPGPNYIDLPGNIRIIIGDSQWWLRNFDSVVDTVSDCNTKSKDDYIVNLESILRTSEGKTVVYAQHHPLYSSGEHGGFFDWKNHIFPLRNVAKWAYIPLPVFGSIYPLLRNNGITPQDVSHSSYKVLIERLDTVFKKFPPLLTASGHDHNLQINKVDGKNYYSVISGRGTKRVSGDLTYKDFTIFAAPNPGYMVLKKTFKGKFFLSVVIPSDSGEIITVFRTELSVN